jgi:hypothetical protein
VSPIPSIKQHAKTDCRLHGAAANATRLGDTQVQGLLDLRRQLSVGLYRHEDFRRFDAHFEIVEN